MFSFDTSESSLKGLLFLSQASKNAVVYNNGLLKVSGNKVFFKKAYYDRGLLVLVSTYGVISGKIFSAGEIFYDQEKKVFTAERIYLKSEEKSVVRKKFRIKL